MRYHINTYMKSTDLLVNSEGFADKESAERAFWDDRASDEAGLNMAMESATDELAAAISDETTDDPIAIMRSLELHPSRLYDYRVEPCNCSTHCLACIEAGLIILEG